jgi:2,5-diketo-D-gluconate reductase A
MNTVPTVILNNGVAMPQLGFGVFQVPNDETEAAVTAALEAGYRSIDTAAVYGNEEGVGRAIAASGLPRDELFITTKLWNSDHERPIEAYDRSVERLGVELADLYLIHWPTPGRDLYVRAWRGLEELYAAGRVRAIGVSNFLPAHLDRIVGVGGTVPAVNQVEIHPALQQRAIQDADRRLGIATEAWSPLAHGAVLAEPAVTTIAERLGRTPAQVILRWHLQQGRIVIPKSVTPSRIADNLDVFAFDLAADDLAAIDRLEDGNRVGPDPAVFDAA